MGVNVKIHDRGIGSRRWKTVFGDKPASVKVGIFGPTGDDPVKGDSSLSIVELAEIHEFGLGNAPQRSFVRAYFDDNEPKLREMLGKLMTRLIARTVRSGNPITDADRLQILGQMGVVMVGQIQQRMADGIGPALAPATIARKGSSTPLIDTGQLRQAITYEVDLTGKAT